MGFGVVTVGRREYAVGLYWENSPSSRVVAAAKEAATQEGQKADFFAIRAGQKDGRVPQFGLGLASAGHKVNMPAFAGCLANQQLGSWVGAFRLREGTVVTVVRDDLIVPDGDQLFLDEGEARERLLQEVSFGGLQRIYAPESWSIPSADNMPISLLMDERRDVKLQVVKTPKNVLIAGGILLGLIIIGLGVGLYLQQQAAKEAELEAQKMNELARARELANDLAFGTQAEPKYPPPERKWESRPIGLEVVEACRLGLSKVPAAVAGWKSMQMKCDGITLSVTWTRRVGNSSPPTDLKLDESGSVATQTIPLQKLTPRGHEDLANPDDITRRYLGQDWNGKIARLPDDPPPPPPPNYKGKWNPPPAPWVKRSFTVTVPQLPSALSGYFQGLPGVIINSMDYTPKNANLDGAWTVEGVIYENRI